MKLQLTTDKDFQEIPRLRWKLDADRCPIAYPVRKRFRGDHLYFHGPGNLGVYIERKTRNAFSRSVRAYKEMIRGEILTELLGDQDGIIVFRCREVKDIPKVFFLVEPRNPSGRGGFADRVSGVKTRAEASDGVQIPPESLASQTTPSSRVQRDDPDFEQYQQEHVLWPEMDMEVPE